jgi:hypothetical protein
MNNKLFFKFLIITAFLLIGTIGIGQVQAQDVSHVGVKVGDSFNYKVTKNDFASSLSYFNELFTYYNISELSTNSQYNFSYLMQTINQTISPGVDSVVGITVVQLPTSTSDSVTGALNYTFGSTTKTVTTGFLIGTPVTFTDWSFWKTSLYNIATTTDSSADPQIVTGVFNNSETFNATVSVTFAEVPDSLANSGYNSLSVSLDAFYNATTGVLNSETITLKLQGTVPLTQQFTFERTTQPLTSNSNTNTATSSTPGFEALAVLSAIPVVAVYYKRKN